MTREEARDWLQAQGYLVYDDAVYLTQSELEEADRRLGLSEPKYIDETQPAVFEDGIGIRKGKTVKHEYFQKEFKWHIAPYQTFWAYVSLP